MTLTPILETVDIVVYGPPATFDLVTDIGAQGDRGTNMYSGLVHPDTFTSITDGVASFSGETLRLRDMYYHVNNDTFYQWLNGSSGLGWYLRGGLKRLFTRNDVLTFTSGVATLTIPVTDLWGDVDLDTLTADDVVVNVGSATASPYFITVVAKTFSGNVPDELELTFNGFGINMGTAVPYLINGSVTTQILISVV